MKRVYQTEGCVGFESATLIVDVTRFSGPYTSRRESKFWYVEAYTHDNPQYFAQELCRSYSEAIAMAKSWFDSGVQLTLSAVK